MSVLMVSFNGDESFARDAFLYWFFSLIGAFEIRVNKELLDLLNWSIRIGIFV
jgi:hypothetical protein